MTDIKLFDADDEDLRERLTKVIDDLVIGDGGWDRSVFVEDQAAALSAIFSALPSVDDAAGGRWIAGVFENNGVYFTDKDGEEVFRAAITAAAQQETDR